jgi:acyl-CoA thioester hydrolase
MMLDGPVDDSPGAGRFVGRVHRLPVRVYYEDTDFTGVVYHAGYLRFFERGRSEFLRLAGLGHAELLELPAPIAFVVARMEIDFVKPARIDDALNVVTTYDTLKGPRIFIGQSVYRGQELLGRANVTVACIGLDRRPRKPPAFLVQRLAPYFLSSPSGGAP